MIPKLEDGVVLHINEDIQSSEKVSDLLRSRSLSMYTTWQFENAWVCYGKDYVQKLSIRIDHGGDPTWYWLTQFGWVSHKQLEDLVYSVE